VKVTGAARRGCRRRAATARPAAHRSISKPLTSGFITGGGYLVYQARPAGSTRARRAGRATSASTSSTTSRRPASGATSTASSERDARLPDQGQLDDVAVDAALHEQHQRLDCDLQRQGEHPGHHEPALADLGRRWGEPAGHDVGLGRARRKRTPSPSRSGTSPGACGCRATGTGPRPSSSCSAAAPRRPVARPRTRGSAGRPSRAGPRSFCRRIS